MSIMTSHDHTVRQIALDPKQSFIMRAPAGSGKTELLIQRFLCLLSQVSHPEAVVAITFTRKAAAEMRERILSALASATQSTAVNDHQKITLTLAQQVLIQDKKQGWCLQNNPNQLRILTIDALAAAICSQIPLSSGLGIRPTLVDNAEILYQRAVHALIHEKRCRSSIETILLYLDNRIERLESLLTHILSHREQWLPHIMQYHRDPTGLKETLKQGLEHIAIETMMAANAALPEHLHSNIVWLLQHIQQEFKKNALPHLISASSPVSQFPGIHLKDFPCWRSLAHLLLTQKGEWRKIIDKRLGFSSQYADEKNRLMSLLNILKGNEPLKNALTDLLSAPPLHYEPTAWTVIHALTQVLPLLVAHLHLIFSEQGVIDFVELTLGALRALSKETHPTDWALYLDNQIHHLLVDEFQDTSVTQFRLIEQLLSGWQPHDGRTVFLVGDPMQSIYHFRHADVSLFLRAEQQGIAHLPLKSLTLPTNFRSDTTLVHWVNTVFTTLLPRSTDGTIGAVSYTPAVGIHNNTGIVGVKYYAYPHTNEIQEAQMVIDIIHRCQQENPTTNIAILVRARHHLTTLLPALANASLSFQATDIDPLGNRPEIRDVLTLTRALLHRGDRIAWLALLRAPWCGLTLTDLYHLAHSGHPFIWQALWQYHTLKTLSQDGIQRLQRIVPVLIDGFAQEGHLPLTQWIQGIWIALGGPATLQYASQIDHVKSYFNLLEEMEDNFSIALLENKLNQWFTNTTPSTQTTLHVMTIHKAKGLEFDHVIIPGLHRKVSHSQNPILMWRERTSSLGSTDFILAPIPSPQEPNHAIYNYLSRIEKLQLHYEMGRLLYVAATRAKQSLHLISAVDPTVTAPEKGSFLALLWPVCGKTFQQAFNHRLTAAPPVVPSPPSSTVLMRLTQAWQSPLIKAPTADKNPPPFSTQAATRPGISHTPERLGQTIHEALEILSREDIRTWNTDKINSQRSRYRRRLQQLGVLPQDLESTTDLVLQALHNTLQDPQGRWMVSRDREKARSEYAFTVIDDNQPVHYRIDRTFIDQGIRWIIDYKTSLPTHEPIEVFLKKEQACYHGQLTSYAKAWQRQENRPIKLGLYFPLCAAWCEWEHI